MRVSYSYCYEADNASATAFETYLEMIGKYNDELPKQVLFNVARIALDPLRIL